jgi:hypothetical protein
MLYFSRATSFNLEWSLEGKQGAFAFFRRESFQRFCGD